MNTDRAQQAWIEYRDAFLREHNLKKRKGSSRLRRREFIAGYEAAIKDGAR